MDFWATLQVIVRRWYVVLPVFLLALTGVAQVYRSVPTHYTSEAVLLVSTPPTGGTAFANGYVPDPANPLLLPSHGLDVTAAMLIQAMKTADFTERVGVPDDGSVTLTVNNGSDNPELLLNGPFVFVAADGAAPDGLDPLLARAVAGASQELARVQAQLGTPATTSLNLTTVVAPSTPTAQRSDRQRSAGSALGLGLVLTLASAFAAESVAAARRRRRDAGAAPAPPAPPPAGSELVTSGSGGPAAG